MTISSRSVSSWIDVGTVGSNDSGSALDQCALAGLTLAAVVVLVHRRFDWSGTLRRQKWLIVLLLYMLASTLWSEIPWITLRRWAREVIVFPMALLIVSEANSRRALMTIIRRSAYVLLPFSIVLIKYYPAFGREYGRWSGIVGWTGVTTQKNQLGRLCMISAFFLLWALYQHWREHPAAGWSYLEWADASLILLAVYLLKNADSSTSIATLLGGAATFLGLGWLRKWKIHIPQTGLMALVTVIAVFGASAPFLGGSNVAIFSASLNRDSTLTGRTEIWAAVLPAMEQHALVGYGLGSFWTDARRELYFNMPTAHNGYLDILLELGEVGLAFYGIWVLSCARQLHRALAQDYEWASLGISLLFMTLVYNTTESALNSLAQQLTVVLVFTTLVATSKMVTAKRREDRMVIAVTETGTPMILEAETTRP